MRLWCRKPNERRATEGSQALEQAKSNLEEAKSDREEVTIVSTFLRGQRIENHLSARIERLLREGR